MNVTFDCDAPGATPNLSSAGQAVFDELFQRRFGIRSDVGGHDLQSFGEEQRRPARADNAGSDDRDPANGFDRAS